MRELINHTEITKKLIKFLQRNYDDPSCTNTIILILKAL